VLLGVAQGDGGVVNSTLNLSAKFYHQELFMRLQMSVVAVIMFTVIAPQSAAQEAQSQDASRKPITAEMVKNSFSAMCAPMVSGVLNGQEISLPLMDIESISETACACTAKRAFSDTRIAEILRLPEQELESRVKSQNFRNYLLGRLVASLYGCLGENINEQVNSADLEF